MSGNEVILGLVALVLVVFSLVVSLLIPRRDPGFPGRNLRVFAVVAVLLVVGMLTAVEVLGESHGGEAGHEGGEATATMGGTETGGGGGGGGGQGDPAAGKRVFASVSPGCGSCHTLEDAGSSGEIGPNLDEALQGKDAASIEEAIVNPDAQIAEGFSPGVMPSDFGEKLDDKELSDLVAYLVQQGGG